MCAVSQPGGDRRKRAFSRTKRRKGTAARTRRVFQGPENKTAEKEIPRPGRKIKKNQKKGGETAGLGHRTRTLMKDGPRNATWCLEEGRETDGKRLPKGSEAHYAQKKENSEVQEKLPK